MVCQVHGYCLAGDTELATICDFRIVAEDSQIGYPPVRAMTTQDMMWTPWHLPMAKAREFAYVGDSFSGAEMERLGWANYAVPGDQLADFVERFARRMAHIDNDMLMYSERAVNRQCEVMGIRTGLWSGTEIQGSAATAPRAASSAAAHARMASRPRLSGATARSATSAGLRQRSEGPPARRHGGERLTSTPSPGTHVIDRRQRACGAITRRGRSPACCRTSAGPRSRR